MEWQVVYCALLAPIPALSGPLIADRVLRAFIVTNLVLALRKVVFHARQDTTAALWVPVYALRALAETTIAALAHRHLF